MSAASRITNFTPVSLSCKKGGGKRRIDQERGCHLTSVGLAKQQRATNKRILEKSQSSIKSSFPFQLPTIILDESMILNIYIIMSRHPRSWGRTAGNSVWPGRSPHCARAVPQQPSVAASTVPRCSDRSKTHRSRECDPPRALACRTAGT